MALRIINQDLVRRFLTMPVAILLMEEAMRATALGLTLQPPRWILDLPGDQERFFGLMPGAMDSTVGFGAKLTAVFPENGSKGLQSHRGVIALFESEHGAPVAIVHGGEVTAIRTAAASALATRILAHPEAGDLAILGYGEQAVQHLRAMAAVRQLRRVRVWGRSRSRAEAFVAQARAELLIEIEVCSSAEQAVRDADLICTVTGAAEPVLEGRWISEGAHLNVVGSSVAGAREIDTEAVCRARFYVDYKPSTVLQGGEYLAAVEDGKVGEDHIVAEIGQVIIGSAVGRSSDREITLYKSLGIPAEDLICARYLHDRAQRENLGVEVVF